MIKNLQVNENDYQYYLKKLKGGVLCHLEMEQDHRAMAQ